jgi:hypothetical protein
MFDVQQKACMTYDKHVEGAKSRNFALIIAFIGLITWLFSIAESNGATKQQVKINTERWEQLIKNEGDYARQKKTVPMSEVSTGGVAIPRG